MNPFIVYALPRSRTAWLSAFLTYGDWTCDHEQAIFMRSIEDVKTFFDRPHHGTVETAAAQGWHILHHHIPELKALVIRRPVEEVVDSMLHAEVGPYKYDEDKLRKAMTYGNRMLGQVANALDLPVVDYADLESESTCRGIFEYCLNTEFDRNHFQRLHGQHIEADIPAYIRYYHENQVEISKFKSTCWRELRVIAMESTCHH